MVDFLKKNKSFKVVPGNIKEISNGTITDLEKDHFIALLDKSVRLKPDDVVEIIVPDQNNLVKFDSTVIKIDKRVIHLTIPEEVRHIQRREFSRVNISIPVRLNEINNPESTLDSVTKNLSGGGMQLIIDKTFNVGSLLKAKFVILDKNSIETILEVLRVDSDDQSNKEYYLSGKFKDLSNTQRTALIQVCFKRQLELKFKGIKSDLI